MYSPVQQNLKSNIASIAFAFKWPAASKKAIFYFITVIFLQELSGLQT